MTASPRMASSPPLGSRPRRPSRLGLVLTFCLLIGLLIWRFVMPQSPFWLDLAALLGVGMVLLIVKLVLRSTRALDREDASRN